MQSENFKTEKLPPPYAERILTSLEVAAQKIEILEAIPELCSRILARDINLETVLGEETSGSLLHLALLRRNYEKLELENAGVGRVSDMRSGVFRDFIGSDSISPWSTSVSRASNKSEGKDRKREIGASEIPFRSVHGLKNGRGINLSEKEGRLGSVVSANGNRNSSEQSEESKMGAGGSEDVLEGRQARAGSKNIEEAVAPLCKDSSEVTFLRDVINASVTNAQATNKHSDVDNLDGYEEGNNLESAGGAEEQIDVSDMSHSVSTRTNNMLQLIRQALSSKYGDHARRCIQDKDAKALLCILSLLEPHHCFTLIQTANPIKGTKSNNTELLSQTRQSNSSLNSTPPLHNKSSHPSPTNTSQLQAQLPFHSPTSSPPNNTHSRQQQLEHERNLQHSMSISTGRDATDQNKWNLQTPENSPASTSIAEIRRQKLLQKKSESLGQSADRILETIEEVEYQEYDDSIQFQQISPTQNQSPQLSIPNSSARDQGSQERDSDLRLNEILENSEDDSRDFRIKRQNFSGIASEDSVESYNATTQIVKVPLQEEYHSGSSTSEKSTSQPHPAGSMTKQNDGKEYIQKTSGIPKRNSRSDSMVEYFAQLDNFTDRNSETNETEKSMTKSISINFVSDDNITPSTSEEPKWFKDIATEFISKETLRNRLRELFRSIFNDILFNMPALEFIKRIKNERENKEKVVAVNGSSDLSNGIFEKDWQRNSANERLQCSEGLVELKTLVVQLEKLMRARFVMNFEEDRKQTKYCRDLWIKEQRSQRKIQKVKEQLEIEAAKWKPKIALLDSEIKMLEDQLNALPETSLRNMKTEIMEGLKANIKMRKQHSSKQEISVERMREVQNAYDNLTQSNFLAECKFRQKQHDMTKELEGIILKYDAVIDARQQFLDGLQVEEERLQKEIQKQDDKFKSIDDRYLDMRAAKRLKEIMKGIEVANSFKKTWAAKRIQEAWRRYKINKLKKKRRKGLKKKSSKANLKKGSATSGPETTKKDRSEKSKSSDSVSSPNNVRSRSQSTVSNSKQENLNTRKGVMLK